MIESRFKWGFLILFAAFVVSTLPNSVKAKDYYLLHSQKTSEWCAYANITDWKIDAQEVGNYDQWVTVSTQKIVVGHESLSGDWLVEDTYLLEHGEIVKLKRLHNSLSHEFSFKQTFKISNGHAIKINQTLVRLGSKEKLNFEPNIDYDLNFPIYTSIKDIPLYKQMHQPTFETKLCQ